VSEVEKRLRALPRPTASGELDDRIERLMNEVRDDPDSRPLSARWIGVCAVVTCCLVGWIFIRPKEFPRQDQTPTRLTEVTQDSSSLEVAELMALVIHQPKRPRLWGTDSLTFQVDGQ